VKKAYGTLLALLCLVAAPTFATEWGVHAASESESYYVPRDSFRFDTINFSLASPSNLTLTGTPSSFGIVGQTRLFFGLAPQTPTGAPSSFSVYEFPSASYSFSGLAAGLYSIRFGVMSMAESDGSFNLTSTISAVPEPATYAMLLVGLGVVAVMVRRRRALVRA
jgi:PEP-CTERM motif-containing protein